MGICASVALCRLASLLGTVLPLCSGFWSLHLKRVTLPVLYHFFYFCFAFMLRGKKYVYSNNSHYSQDVFFLCLTSNALCI